MLQRVTNKSPVQKNTALTAFIALSFFIVACGETEPSAAPIESTAASVSEPVAAVAEAKVTTVAKAANSEKDMSGYVHGFEFMDMDGKLRNSSEWQGKTLLVNYWATWCVPCRKEMPVLMELHDKYADQDFVVIGIAADEPDKIAAFLETTPVSYPILYGESDAVFENSAGYGNSIGVLPHSAFVDRNGVVRHSKVGEVTFEQVEALLLDIL